MFQNSTSDQISNTTFNIIISTSFVPTYNIINTTNCVIALSAGICIFTLLFIYYIKLARAFIGKPQDKMYYYLSCCVCIFPPVMYIVQLLNTYLLYNGNYTYNSVMYFYIEWIIATPLLLINFGKLATLQLNEYLLLLIANELLFIFGYVFNITADLVIAMPFFGIAATSYIGIIVFLFYKYNTLKAQYDILQRKITNCLIYSTFIILNIYPVISLLYKFNCLTMDQIVIAYVILDIFAKGFFTFIIIGLRELVTRRSSITSYVTRRALRITPLEIQNYDTEVNIRTSSVDEFCRRVDIDGESKVESLQEY